MLIDHTEYVYFYSLLLLNLFNILFYFTLSEFILFYFNSLFTINY